MQKLAYPSGTLSILDFSGHIIGWRSSLGIIRFWHHWGIYSRSSCAVFACNSLSVALTIFIPRFLIGHGDPARPSRHDARLVVVCLSSIVVGHDVRAALLEKIILRVVELDRLRCVVRMLLLMRHWMNTKCGRRQ
ncbi:hypothetical protein CPB86DRAFT_530392 [Serendipita vermifera]|nr:hypothetical protein CPB86DRAFT_530392 [Serendipita vermifera]